MDPLMPSRWWQLGLLISVAVLACGVVVGELRGWTSEAVVPFAIYGVFGVFKSAGGRFLWWRRFERGTPRRVPLLEIVGDQMIVPGLSWDRELRFLIATAAEAAERHSGSPRMLLRLRIGGRDLPRAWYSRRSQCWAVDMPVPVGGADPEPLHWAVTWAYDLVASRAKGADLAPLAAICAEVENARSLETADEFEAALTALETALMVIDTDPRLAGGIDLRPPGGIDLRPPGDTDPAADGRN